MLDGLKKRLRDLRSVPYEVAVEAAPTIRSRLEKISRSPEGIRATPRAEAIVITAPAAVLQNARKRGQIEVWKDLVRDAFRRVV